MTDFPHTEQPIYHAQLNWYLFDNSASVFHSLWQDVSDYLASHHVKTDPAFFHESETAVSLASRHTLALGQICGLSYGRSLRNRLSYLASFIIDERSVQPGYYHSVIMTARPMTLAAIQTEHPNLAAAINEPDSFSGRFALYLAIVPDITAPPFKTEIFTGSHLETVRAIAAGKAEIGGIDCLSWLMIQRAYPELVPKIFIAGHSAPMPAPPLIASASLDHTTLELVQEALTSAFKNPELAQQMYNIGITGITMLDEDAFRCFEHFQPITG